MPSRLRTVAGAIVYDLLPFEFRLRRAWQHVRNRRERVAIDGDAVHCEWDYAADLHLPKVFPSIGARLMSRAFAQWPIALRHEPRETSSPEITFVIGHRGVARLPHLLMTLQSIAGQSDAQIECIVVEQSSAIEIETSLPPWVRYVHTAVAPAYDYNRAWTLNVGTRLARGTVVILHDNDMLCPERYAAEVLARARQGAEFLDLKRFTFYLDEQTTQRVFDTGSVPANVPSTIVQNLQGASIAAVREAYEAIGGFDESFVGWGGEDNEFWERARTRRRVNAFGYLPFLHLWHAPQKGKLEGQAAPAVQRFWELTSVAPEERIGRLRSREWGSPLAPATD